MNRSERRQTPLHIPGARVKVPRLAAYRAAADSSHPEADNNAARTAILTAARAESSAKGLTGSRVNEIAARAGVNKQLIYYYYFGSKGYLYRMVLEVVYTEIRIQERSLNLGDIKPEEAMATLIGFLFDCLARHPDFIRLLNHENAQGGQHVRNSSAIRDTNSQLIELITKTLARGNKAKVFRQTVDIRFETS